MVPWCDGQLPAFISFIEVLLYCGSSSSSSIDVVVVITAPLPRRCQFKNFLTLSII